MGTHPIFESDFDCLTEGLPEMPRSRRDRERAEEQDSYSVDFDPIASNVNPKGVQILMGLHAGRVPPFKMSNSALAMHSEAMRLEATVRQMQIRLEMLDGQFCTQWLRIIQTIRHLRRKQL